MMTKRNSNFLLTSESVSDGHPDKICDQVSDAILDAALAGDPSSRVACETSCTTNRLWMFGEITTSSKIDFEAVARKTIHEIGYDDPEYQFDHETCEINVYLHAQSPDIDAAVSTALEDRGASESDQAQQGAGDQGMMIGYAVDETPELMPLPISLAHRLTKSMSDARRHGDIPYLRPDAKSQVTVEYNEDHEPQRIDTIVLSTWHAPDVKQSQIEADLIAKVIDPLVPSDMRDDDTKYLINPSGRFVTGGPHGDAGLTGRKIIVDTYGGSARHGGGAFSGKDPSKVDRSRRIRRPLRRQKHRRRRPRKTRRSPDRIRHRKSRTRIPNGGDPRHRQTPKHHHRRPRQQNLRPPTKRHHRIPKPPTPHLPPSSRIRPLRTPRPRPPLGTNQQSQNPPHRRRNLTLPCYERRSKRRDPLSLDGRGLG